MQGLSQVVQELREAVTRPQATVIRSLRPAPDAPVTVLSDFADTISEFSFSVTESASEIRRSGLSLSQLAKGFNLKLGQLSSRRSQLTSEAFLLYLQEQTGVTWTFNPSQGRYGRYFPVEESSQTP